MRLIDADEENGKLLDFIAENANSIQYAIEHKDMTILEDIFFEYFEAQKIVYDVDKVAKKISDYYDLIPGWALREMIEIVKVGGVNE